MSCETKRFMVVGEIEAISELIGCTVFDVRFYETMQGWTTFVKVYPGKWTNETFMDDLIVAGYDWNDATDIVKKSINGTEG